MKLNFRIEEAGQGKGAVAERIMRALPDWFGIESSIVQYHLDVDEMLTFFCAVPEGEVVGFLTLHFHNKYSAELHVLGVLPQFHRQGLGRALVNRAEEAALDRGIEYLQVKTVGESRPDPYYERTREFYMKMGFRPLEEFASLWPGYPCLVMVKKTAH